MRWRGAAASDNLRRASFALQVENSAFNNFREDGALGRCKVTVEAWGEGNTPAENSIGAAAIAYVNINVGAGGGSLVMRLPA